ncbi:MAG: DUF1376 domain-containing protein [Candidatus Peribacteraceae bacterium]|nr:DUF1376 domain-containing protein [Candidatus Peribacteraceae bacterium]
MNKSPAFQFYPKDWLSDANVVSMTNEQKGIYITLLCHCWLEGSIPSDVSALSRLCGVQVDRMKKLWPEIERCFKQKGDGFIHYRLVQEGLKQKLWREKSSAGGIRSARIRAARAKGSHTEEEWLFMLSVIGEVCPRCGSTTLELVKDHVVPVYQGGSDQLNNIQPLCRKCNAEKGPEAIDWIKDKRLLIASRVVQPNGNTPVSSLQSAVSSLPSPDRLKSPTDFSTGLKANGKESEKVNAALRQLESKLQGDPSVILSKFLIGFKDQQPGPEHLAEEFSHLVKKITGAPGVRSWKAYALKAVETYHAERIAKRVNP